MDSKAFRTKSTRVARKRTKAIANSTDLAQEALKRVRVTRSMQRRMTTGSLNNVDMKENSGGSGSMMQKQEFPMAPGLTAAVPRLKHQGQLSCKENISEYSEGQGESLLASLRQRQLPSGHQHVLEVNRECVAMDTLTPKHLLPSDGPEYRGQASFPTAHAHIRTSKQQPAQQQSCKLKISQLMSCDTQQGSVNASGNPLPPLQWVRSAELWWTMRSKDISKAAPEAELRLRHPEILSTMRIILLDWMMEVCEEYKLHRETYYLAVDLFDRFMDTQANVRKEQLQLLGVTCLFVASKVEEIYPPKAHDFAYVTDGACSVADLLDTELIVCKVLQWKLNHVIVTVNTWVNTYMQLGSHHLRPPGVKAKEFEFPAYSSVEFPKVMKLLDLCLLDIASRQFGSSVLAASAVYLQSERTRPYLSVITGFELRDIQMCLNWMHPLAVVLSQKAILAQKAIPGVPPHDTHNIQTHDVSISMLEDSFELRQPTSTQYALLQDCSVMMTPPRNERRCLAPINTAC